MKRLRKDIRKTIAEMRFSMSMDESPLDSLVAEANACTLTWNELFGKEQAEQMMEKAKRANALARRRQLRRERARQILGL